MTTQQALRNRIHSAENIMHITQAMEVVSGVRFRKLMHRVEHFRLYSKKLSEVMGRLKVSADAVDHPLFHCRNPSRVGVVIITGDKGLCGAYNERVLKEAESFLRALESKSAALFLFGNKAIEYFKKKPWLVKHNYPDFARNLSEGNVKRWCEEWMVAFTNKDYDELWVVFTHFNNILSNELRVEKILPLTVSEPEQHPESINYLFEPAPEKIYARILPCFFNVKVLSILYDAYASELSSRLISMKAATKNAEDMMERLTLIKNKNRQLAITKEILEITAGAEGLK